MILTISVKKFLSYLLSVLVVFGFVFIVINSLSSASAGSLYNYTIVIDAGHGGRDGGSVGVVTGVKESDLNLQVSKKLKSYLQKYGFNVVLTRQNEHGLYKTFSRDYKLEDMNVRKDIILKNKANIVISIHMNSYSSPELRGIQAFYNAGDEVGKQLATVLQNSFYENLEHAKSHPNKGDYFILNATTNPSVLIECGYLTNKDEELLLQTDEYQEKLAYQIFYGVLKYFQEIQLKEVSLTF